MCSFIPKISGALGISAVLAACSSGGGNSQVPPLSGAPAAQSHAAAASNVRYKFIDLGTLGGPTSYGSINGAGSSILNNAGVVASRADITSTDPLAPACFNPDCFVSHAARWQKGVISDLGTLSAGGSSAAGGINDIGWAIGQSQTGQLDPLFGLATHATFWGSGPIVDLGTLGGMTSAATGVNDSGEIAGFSETAAADPFFGVQFHDFVWSGGALHDIGTLGGPDTLPLLPNGCGTCINARGQIAGSSFINSTPNASTGFPTYDPFLWQNGHMIDLGSLGGTFGGPTFLTNAGDVVGASFLSGDTIMHPFLWKNGAMKDLGTLGGDNGFPLWANERGDIVGIADLPGGVSSHAFFWRNGAMTDLGTLGTDSEALSVNARGQVVGFRRFTVPSRRPRIFVATGRRDGRFEYADPPKCRHDVGPGATNQRWRRDCRARPASQRCA